MLAWLVPVALFWTLAALYLGGFSIDIEESSGVKHMGGLVLSFVLYLAVYGVLHAVLGGSLSEIWAVVGAALVASALLPLLSTVAFRVFGVRIRSAARAH